jgi:hypothetical protein
MPYQVGYDDDADPFLIVFCGCLLLLILCFERSWYKCACCRKHKNIDIDSDEKN